MTNNQIRETVAQMLKDWNGLTQAQRADALQRAADAAARLVSHYAPMSIPGREDDGSDTVWYVVDRRTNDHLKAQSLDDAKRLAAMLNCR